MKKEILAGTTDEQRTDADLLSSASVEANLMLSAALSVEEGNILIAEFIKLWKGVDCYRYGKDYYGFKNLRFHSSWDWLMPVVKKIQQLKTEEFSKKKPVMSALIDVDIKILHKAVVVFLQWYNRQSNVSVGSR